MERSKGKEIEIRKIVNVLKKRMWIVFLITVVSTVVGMLYTSHTKPTPIYSSSARIIIHENSGFMETLIVFIKEKPVLEGVVEHLELGISPEILGRQLYVNKVGNSQIVEITAINPNHETSTKLANTVALVFMDKVEQVFNYRNVDMLSEAVMAQYPQPINPASNRMLYIAVIFGFVTSIGFVFLLDSLDNTIRSEREIEKLLEVPVVGTVSKISKKTMVRNKKERKKSLTLRGEIVDSNH